MVIRLMLCQPYLRMRPTAPKDLSSFLLGLSQKYYDLVKRSMFCRDQLFFYNDFQYVRGKILQQ